MSAARLFAKPVRRRPRAEETADREQIVAEAALHSALREVYSGASWSEAGALRDRLEDLGFRVVRA